MSQPAVKWGQAHHTSCSKPGSQILPVYLSKFKNVFGVSIEDILSE
jgi:hypothetical protein